MNLRRVGSSVVLKKNLCSLPPFVANCEIP